jgi:cysteine desulfurase
MIYADNAATTRMSDVAFEKMLPFLREEYGNASSQYSFGVTAKRAIQHSRQQVATAIGAKASEIAFTSGGSEGNSWVLNGVAELFVGESVHIIASAIEHPSVLNACRALEKKGVEVTYLTVNKHGLIEIDALKAAIKGNTKLVSMMFANNEVGTIQPIAKIGEFLAEAGILFHTDAVQAVGHMSVDVNELKVDFLSASAHKFNGPKGVGFLFKRSGLFLPKMVFGGAQEQDLRAGTENVAGIVALGYAIEENVLDMHETQEKLRELVEITASELKVAIPSAKINAKGAPLLPGILNVSFPTVPGEAMMHLLDLKGICVSTSSACNVNNDEPSHVLRALGMSVEQSKRAIRISYGRYNALNEAHILVDAICDVYHKIIAMHGD